MSKKICNICSKRPVSKNAGIEDACVPCYEEGAWENQHQDDDHEELTEVFTKATWQVDGAFKTGAVELRKLAPKAGIKNAGQHKSAELRVLIVDAVTKAQAGCWICHPELNEAQAETKTRKVAEGERPSRKGQVINVPLRAPGEVKAAVVVKVAPSAKVFVMADGSATLTLHTGGLELVLAWDAEGRYDYVRSSARLAEKTRKVRNVAEALRLIAQTA